MLALLVMALLASLFINLLQFSSGLGGAEALAAGSGARKKPRLGEVVQQTGTGSDKIVQIDLEGIITSVAEAGFFGAGLSSVEKIKRQLEQAREDDKVKAIVLRVNSPGGEVTASDTLYAAVKTAAERKPVVVFMDSMAASGGYYVACGAGKVVATETTLTGSIGVIIDAINYSELFDKVGLHANTFVSGAFKDSLSGARPMREDERAYIQNLVSQMYERFLGVVSEARKLPKDVLRNGVADGRVLTGREALEAGLVDRIGYLEDAYSLARELGGAESAGVVRYRHEPSLFEIFGGVSAQAAQHGGTLKVELAPGWPSSLQPGLPYYLSPLAAPSR